MPMDSGKPGEESTVEVWGCKEHEGSRWRVLVELVPT